MLRHEQDLSAASKDSDEIGIWILLSNVPQILFCSKKPVEASVRIEFIYKYDLSSFLDHTMAGVAWEDKDSLTWVISQEFV